MIELIPTNQSVQAVLGIACMLAFFAGFVISMGEMLLKSRKLSEFKKMHLEILGLGVLMLAVGFFLPGLSVLMASGFAILLILWPLSYPVIYAIDKKERSGLRLAAAFLFSVYLVLGASYMIL
jgi:hypothetical protein